MQWQYARLPGLNPRFRHAAPQPGTIDAMKINLLSAGVFVAALAMPLGVCAQQGQPTAARAHAKSTGTPSHAKLSHRWQKRLGNLNLSGDQQQRVQSLIDRYSQDHPEGS